MTTDNRWLLPDGIDELLPERAARVEYLRRTLLDKCQRWGFRYVIPPQVEFTESLLVGMGADLDLLTCKFVDRTSGRTLGVRADITPQVTRIDAHSLGESGVTRLCYAGSILHSARQSVTEGRSPIQLGAEIYGSDALSADLEVISLMLDVLLGVGGERRLILDIGHVGIVESVIKASELDASSEAAIFDALQCKSWPDLTAALAAVPAAVRENFESLSSLHGDQSVLPRARSALGAVPGVIAALNVLDEVVATLTESYPDLEIYIDLMELRSFQYHTGLVFAAYYEGVGTAVAKGGRYDNIGQVYGRARPATGFSLDLKKLAGVAVVDLPGEALIAAPDSQDPALLAAVQALRHQGRTVVTSLAGELDIRCTAQLIECNGQWIVESLPRAERE